MKIIKWIGVSLALLFVVSAVAFFGFVPAIAEKGMNTVEPHVPYQISTSARALHDSLVIADLHADSTLWNRDLLKRSDYGHVDIPRMVAGNQAIQVFTTVTKTPAGMNYNHNSAEARDNITLLAVGQLWPIRTWNSLTERALYQASRLHKMEAKAPQQFKVIETQQDLRDLLTARANGSEIVGGLIGTEGSHALDGELSNIDRLYDAGFRMMSLHHFFDNKLGGSLHGTSQAGLTDFGKSVVRKLDSMPVVLDLSHSSEAVVEQALAMVTHPVVISHTGMHGHCESPRNIADSLMQKIAAQGGVVGIGYWDAVCDISPQGIASAIAAAVELLGEDHVGLGSDFDGSVHTSLDSSELAVITQALMARGFSADVIRKVMGGNVVRVFGERLPTEN